ncbi:GDSL esterase/lipase 6-like [Bidens hawaiensis]|uniref:GDSL esterase/lipase 6-like n=1 Tax=Bidens hawaiensis TaxID=980011 RepID=UPI00404A088D
MVSNVIEMMARRPLLIIFLGVFLIGLTSVDANVKLVFVFGDSQFDPGNNQYVKNCYLRANFTPYGSSFFHHPTGRFTNGRTVPDFVAQFLGIKFQKPYQEVYQLLANDRRMSFPSNGLNFASAGSGLLPGTNRDAAVTSIQVQQQQFQFLIGKTPLTRNSSHKHLHIKQIQKSIFFLVSGGNDVFQYFLLPRASKMTSKAYVDAMLKEVVRFTSRIYKSGGRRIVLFSLGPVSCIPGRVLIPGAPSNRCIDKLRIMASQFNDGLKRIVKNIPRMYPGSIGVYAAVYDTTKKYLDNPKRYGFANITHACCGGGPLNGALQCGLMDYKICLKPNEYFFWDYFHPTEHTYALISKTFWAGGKEEIWPVNLKALASHKYIP